jgi:hypothetical protein
MVVRFAIECCGGAAGHQVQFHGGGAGSTCVAIHHIAWAIAMMQVRHVTQGSVHLHSHLGFIL